jgi:hypothetical protein
MSLTLQLPVLLMPTMQFVARVVSSESNEELFAIFWTNRRIRLTVVLIRRLLSLSNRDWGNSQPDNHRITQGGATFRHFRRSAGRLLSAAQAALNGNSNILMNIVRFIAVVYLVVGVFKFTRQLRLKYPDTTKWFWISEILFCFWLVTAVVVQIVSVVSLHSFHGVQSVVYLLFLSSMSFSFVLVFKAYQLKDSLVSVAIVSAICLLLSLMFAVIAFVPLELSIEHSAQVYRTMMMLYVVVCAAFLVVFRQFVRSTLRRQTVGCRGLLW